MSKALVVSTPSPDDAVVAFEEVSRKLAAITTIKEAKAVADEAQALRVYARRAQSGLEAQNRCALVKIAAERRAGQLLKEVPQAPIGGAESGRGEKHSNTKGECLEELGINWAAASRWERLAEFPDDEWEAWMAEAMAGKYEGELTSAAVDRMARRHQRSRAIAEDPDWKARLYAAEVNQAVNRLLKEAYGFLEPGRERDHDLALVLADNQEVVDELTFEKLCHAFVHLRFRVSYAVEALRKRFHGEQAKWLSRTSEVERLTDAEILNEVVATT